GVEYVAPEVALVLGQWISNFDITALRATDEWHGPRLEQSGANEGVANAAGNEPLWIVWNIARAEGANLVRKSVVAAESRHFLDEVDLAGNVRAPGWRQDAQGILALDASLEADGLQESRGLLGGNCLTKNRCD